MVVIREAARLLGNYRLTGTTLYVTLEPCAMCAGAIVQARIPRLVYAADDPKGGAFRSCFDVLTHPKLNHQVDVTSGVLAQDSASLLQIFLFLAPLGFSAHSLRSRVLCVICDTAATLPAQSHSLGERRSAKMQFATTAER